MWSRFRRDPDVWAYCEIFHEALAALTSERAADFRYGAWNSGHPASAPYFLEFLPLLDPQGGISSYDPSMAFARFIPNGGLSGALSEAERAYVDALIVNAHRQGRRPVLTDTRTLGRVKAIKSAYPSPSILLVRNLFHQWASYASQAIDGNSYFIAKTDQIIRAAEHDDFSRSLSQWCGDRLAAEDNEAMFKIFLIHHLYVYAHAFDAADIIVDVNEIAGDARKRILKENELHELLGIRIDLSTIDNRFTTTNLEIEDMDAFVDDVDQWVKLISSSGASSAGLSFAERMKTEAISEIERYHFYTRGLRKRSVDAIQRIRDLEASKYWKLTAPLRSVSGWLKRIAG